METPAVTVDHCTRAYGDFVAVNDVSLEIRQGEFFTLLGSSGSGKTTTLRMIAGFERPDAGRILIGGHDVTWQPAHRRNVHTVFQDYALFPHMTVFNNVAFSLRVKRHSRDDLRKSVMEAIEMVQLAGFEKRKPTQLSGGQQQRVALARALVDHPSVLLLDEPLSALDAKIRGEVREELKTLQRNTGITFIYVTHDQEEALTLSDRMAIMRHGKVLQVGPPLQVYEQPADLFVAEFIGKANFVPGVLKSVEGKKAIVQANGSTVGASVLSPIEIGSNVVVMIRPENMRITAAESAAGTIKQSSYLGHGTEYLIDHGSDVFRALQLRRRGEVPLPEGAKVECHWNWEEAIVFRK